MREHVSRQKKTTTDFSIPSLKHPTRGFGLESSAILRQAVPEIQPLHKPVTHDISRIPLRPQAKLSISQPGDVYEQEADNVAQQVMQRMAEPVSRQPIQREAVPEEEEELQMKPLDISTLQREAVPEEEEELQMKPLDISTLQREALPEEEEELQMKSLDNRTLQREEVPEEEEELQMKSLDNRTLQREEVPEEEEEEELQMKSLDNRTLQREEVPEEEEEEELQMKSLDNRTLQREEVPEEEELQMKSMVQRQSKTGMDATPDLETSINQARGGGQTMADNIRQPMERAFGADFSGVKVHTDGQSDQLNRSIQARAFTTGQDVFFRQGEYNPGSRGGQELLAHELTHVVQQNGGAVQRMKLPESIIQKVPDLIIQLAPTWDASNLATHFSKHQSESPNYKSQADYKKAAIDVVNDQNSLSKSKSDGSGNKVYFNPNTGEFVSTTSAGVIKTLFIPSAGVSYYNKQ